MLLHYVFTGYSTHSTWQELQHSLYVALSVCLIHYIIHWGMCWVGQCAHLHWTRRGLHGRCSCPSGRQSRGEGHRSLRSQWPVQSGMWLPVCVQNRMMQHLWLLEGLMKFFGYKVTCVLVNFPIYTPNMVTNFQLHAHNYAQGVYIMMLNAHTVKYSPQLWDICLVSYFQFKAKDMNYLKNSCSWLITHYRSGTNMTPPGCMHTSDCF